MTDLMILPAADKTKIRLVRIPPDFQDQEVYRHVTRLIAEVEDERGALPLLAGSVKPFGLSREAGGMFIAANRVAVKSSSVTGFDLT